MTSLNKLDKNAFTILELMIATMVFSVVLLLVTTGILNIGKTYYKGALQSRTQGTARIIIDDISRGIQFSGATPVDTTPTAPTTTYPDEGGKYWMCINNVDYAYVLDNQLGDAGVDQGLIKYNGNCTQHDPATAAAQPNATELLAKGMRLTALKVLRVPGTTDIYEIEVGIASGDRDLFDPAVGSGVSSVCKSDSGKEFCAISNLTTKVKKRVK